MQDQNTGKRAKSQDLVTFNEKKHRSYLLADSFKRIHMDARANRVLSCGHYLEFATHIETGQRTLIGADFCRDRLCPMCSWRRSLRVFSDLSKVFDEVCGEGSGYVPVFLTLTVKNCRPEELKSQLVTMQAAWNAFNRVLPVKRAFCGWFRCLEITYNKKDDTMHPHYHVMMLADRDYFSSPDYLSIHKIVKYWRQALHCDYDPVCHIRRIKPKKNCTENVRSAVLEVAKYAVKDTDYIYPNDQDLTDYVVENLAVALNGVRLVAYGGILKQVAKKLKANDDVDDFATIGALSDYSNPVLFVVSRYRWSAGIGKYKNDLS